MAAFEQVETRLGQNGCLVSRGGDYDAWDLEVRAGGLSAVRVRLAIEEHGQGRQMVRFRAEPHYRPVVGVGMIVLGAGALLAVGQLVLIIVVKGVVG